MSLIQNIQADRLAKDAIVLDLGDLGRQAERILGDAREEARVENDRVLGKSISLNVLDEGRGEKDVVV